MIAISTLTYDIDGHLILHVNPDTDFGKMTRRHTRTATLDGESVITDLGYAWSDMTFNINVSRITNEELDQLKYLIQAYPVLLISTKEGCFEGALDSLDSRIYPISFNFLPLKKVS